MMASKLLIKKVDRKNYAAGKFEQKESAKGVKMYNVKKS
jgi:hypothetical protein